MKKHNPIYYLLFILLIMGAFASMAQNSYGLKIMGGVAFAFGLVFIIEFVSVLRKEEKADVFTLVEMACLFLLSIIFGLRIFYIRFPYIELIFGMAAILLALVYLRKMTLRFRESQAKKCFPGNVRAGFSFKHCSISVFAGYGSVCTKNCRSHRSCSLSFIIKFYRGIFFLEGICWLMERKFLHLRWLPILKTVRLSLCHCSCYFLFILVLTRWACFQVYIPMNSQGLILNR